MKAENMRRNIIMGIILILSVAVCLTGCHIVGDDNDERAAETAPDISTAETDEEPQTQIIYVKEYVTEYVEKNAASDEPVGYLKDHLTGTGTLGTDYPVLSGYGPRDSYNGQISAFHLGMDFAMDEGTQLTSPGRCTVSYVGYNDTRGLWIVLYWGSGYYLGLQHLSKIFVEQGEMVQKGQVIALSGNTGSSLTPHLHLDVIQGDEEADTLTDQDFNDDYRRINPYYFVFGIQ